MTEAKMTRLDADGNPVSDPIPVRSFSFTRVDDDDPDDPPAFTPLTIHANGTISGYLTAPDGFSAPSAPMYDPFVRLSQRHPEFFDKREVDPDEDVPMFNRVPEEAKSDEFVFGSDEWKTQQHAAITSQQDAEYATALHAANVRRARMERAAEAEIVNRDVDRLLYEMEHLERDMKREDRERDAMRALGEAWREVGDLARNQFTIFFEAFSGIADIRGLDLGITRAGEPNRASRRVKAKAPTKKRRGPKRVQPSCHHGNLKGSCRQCW